MGHPDCAEAMGLVLGLGGWRGFVVMAVVEDLSNTATCSLRDFAGAFGGAHAYVFSGDCCALADVACRVDGMKGDEIAGAAANVTAGAARLGLGLSRACRVWRLGGCGLSDGGMASDREGYAEERDG